MKIKQLLLSFITLSVFLVSCSKEEIGGIEMGSPKVEDLQSVMSMSTTTSTEPNLKAYIFIEPVSKVAMVSKYLKDSVAHSSRPFLGFAMGYGITSSNKNDILNYMDLKYFYNGQLPAIVTSDIPQTTGGTDSFGQPIKAYNFKTIRITKSQINDNAWVTVFIPVGAMNNDVVKQTKILSYGTGLATRTINTNSTIYGHTLDYNGNKLPKGRYRVYTTFVSSAMRYTLVGSGHVFLKGNN
jgi:hypothetical protein